MTDIYTDKEIISTVKTLQLLMFHTQVTGLFHLITTKG